MNRRLALQASLGAVAAGLLPAGMTAALAQTSTAAGTVPNILSDGDGAKTVRADGLNRVRYIEIFLAIKDPKTGKLVAPCYNSTFSAAGRKPPQ